MKEPEPLVIDEPRMSKVELAQHLRERADKTEAGEFAEPGDKESVDFWTTVDRQAADRLDPPIR